MADAVEDGRIREDGPPRLARALPTGKPPKQGGRTGPIRRPRPIQSITEPPLRFNVAAVIMRAASDAANAAMFPTSS